MQSTTMPAPRSVTYASEQVWDLSAVSPRRVAPPARPSRGGAIAAGLGIAALCFALLPLATETRLFFAIGLGIPAVLVGVSALRRRQTRTALLLAVVGVVTPVVAIAGVALAATHAPSTVRSSTVQRMTLEPDSSTLVPSADFARLTTDEQGAMRSFLAATVSQLQTMHGAWAPLPTSLAVSNGSLVEGDGLFRGTTLGALPPGERLDYQVASDGSAFRIAISSSSDPGATISADRALQIPTAG